MTAQPLMKNTSFRALLIGVPAYDDEAIADLPFVADDIEELSGALSSVGYDVTVYDQETGRDSIEAAIEMFFQDAGQGETLLLYLSGHGVHHNGMDYLVPRGALTRLRKFPEKCLALDFSDHVEHSRAGDVAVFVDACREGITLKEMAAVNTAAWSDMQVNQVGERHYCYVYACSPGERARYVEQPNGAFSIFSRALSKVVAREAGSSTLSELKEELQAETDALTYENNCPRQQIRVRTETEADDFVVIERPDRKVTGPPGEHPWVTAVQDHPAWKQVGDDPGAEAMKQAAVALVTQLASQTDRDETRLAGDPWRPADFAERMTGSVAWLISKVLNAEKLALSPAEAMLLTVVPYLYTAAAHRAAVEELGVDPGNLVRAERPTGQRASYEDFFTSRSRLLRREQAARSGDTEQAAGIAWWLFHRWLARKPGSFQERILRSLLGLVQPLLEGIAGNADRKLVTELLELDTLPTLLRSLQTAFDITLIRPERQLAGSTKEEQRIREQLLVALLTVAHRLAIDPTMLSDVVVEHLGISYSVDLAELRETLRSAHWDPRGRTRVLNAACRHPAVGLALRQHAAELDSILGAIDIQASSEPQLAPLRDLPVHATADKVQAAVDNGKPKYESTDLRFRLADDRIQELLMGEQLYGDPALAIRELYQNALDACRYREARTDYLRHEHLYPNDWSGKIVFRRGVDADGRAYIECRDNGIGMGERELREVFSHAGVRFADLPEYLDEREAWRAAGIELHPNSRFGIGVLSYFMLADDITVITCRLDRDGHPGQRLQVDIAGPGSLFYIRDLGRGYDAGTTVRLYLRSPDSAPSYTDLLRRQLWISPYTVVAEDTGTRLEWEPNVLSPVAPLGAGDPHSEDAVRQAGAETCPTSRADVWWTSTMGGVLADGVWAGVPLFGAVVNLTGEYTPRLTVDRRRILHHDAGWINELLHQEISALLREGAGVFDHQWLSELVFHDPELADTVAEAAVAGRYRPWQVGGYDMDISAAGCFPADAELIDEEGGIAHYERSGVVPSAIANWRALAWAAAGAFTGVRAADPEAIRLARPTDVFLLRAGDGRGLNLPGKRDEWLFPGRPVPLGHVLWAADQMWRRPGEVVARLAEFGLRLADGVAVPESFEPDDLVILSTDINSKAPWLDAGVPVPVAHVLRAADRVGRRPGEVVARLAEFGLRLADGVAVPESFEPGDLVILSRDLDGLAPWLDAVAPAPLAHVWQAASRLRRPAGEVVARLAEFGLRLAEGAAVPESFESDDVLILSQNFDGHQPWLDAGKPLPLGHLLWAAGRVGRRPGAVAARLAEFGLRLADGVAVPEPFGPDDLVILSRGLDGRSPWLDDAGVVPSLHVLLAASRVGRRPEEVADRLAEFGLRRSGRVVMPQTVDPDDVLILSRGLDGRSPWLDAAEPLPLMHVLQAASRLGRRPDAVAARLAEFGFRLRDGIVLPEAVDSVDMKLFGQVSGWFQQERTIDPWNLVRMAVLGERELIDVIQRLCKNGFTVSGDLVHD